MKKYIIGVPIIVLLIVSAISLYFVYETPSQADINASGDICAITDNSSSSEDAQIDTITSKFTEESGKEYLTVNFSVI